MCPHKVSCTRLCVRVQSCARLYVDLNTQRHSGLAYYDIYLPWPTIPAIYCTVVTIDTRWWARVYLPSTLVNDIGPIPHKRMWTDKKLMQKRDRHNKHGQYSNDLNNPILPNYHKQSETAWAKNKYPVKYDFKYSAYKLSKKRNVPFSGPCFQR